MHRSSVVMLVDRGERRRRRQQGEGEETNVRDIVPRCFGLRAYRIACNATRNVRISHGRRHIEGRRQISVPFCLHRLTASRRREKSDQALTRVSRMVASVSVLLLIDFLRLINIQEKAGKNDYITGV